MMTILRRATLACAILLVSGQLLASCSDAEPAPITCQLESAPSGYQRFETVAVHLDDGADPHLSLVKEDLSRYLGQMWDRPVSVASGKPEGGAAIWLSTSEEARQLAGASIAEGYAMRRVDDGSTTLVVWGSDPHNLAYGAYAVLEELGARFFHPKQELVPTWDGAYLPPSLAAEREPAFATRGIQLHTLHPIETWAAVAEPGDKNLADAKRFIDWLVKTGHNELQWWIFGTTDIEAYRPHAAAIIDHAHRRGVRVGVIAQLWGGSSLQNAYTMVDDDEGWQEQMEGSIDELLGLGFDLIELGLGEFFAGDPEGLLAWLNHGTAYIADNYPERELSVVNHVGNYPELWIDYQGEETFFYQLPGHADPRLVNNVHTVFFFDLYRDWGGYNHDDFSLQREFLLGELGERTVRYLPESAYWVTADTDVPIFLPAYLYSRWLDIHRLHEDTAGKLDGHIMFSSGHEWGYWMNDYLAAKAMWQPEAELETFTSHITSAFGSCSGEVGSALNDFVAVQNDYLFDRRLVGYLSGEDVHDDVGALTGFLTTPRRTSYREVWEMSAEERSAFEREIIAGLKAYAAANLAIEQRLDAQCSNPGPAVAPWCLELLDATRVTRIRAQHATVLYEAVIAAASGSGGTAALGEARARMDEARAVIHGRAAHYRWDREHLIGAYDNPTIYKFGYLHQAHTMCYWQRQYEQAASWVEYGAPMPVGSLPTCLD